MTHSAWWLICDALSVYRLAVLVAKDEIAGSARDAVLRRSEPAFAFITCPWCTSVWFAAAVVALTVRAPGVWQYAAMALALSAVAGFVAER